MMCTMWSQPGLGQKYLPGLQMGSNIAAVCARVLVFALVCLCVCVCIFFKQEKHNNMYQYY